MIIAALLLGVSATALASDSDAGLSVMCDTETGELSIGMTWPAPLGYGEMPVFWSVDDRGDWDADMMTLGDTDAGFIAEGDQGRIAEILDAWAAGGTVTVEPQNGGAGAATFRLDPSELASVRAACAQ